MRENALELHGVCKKYGGFALRNVGFTLPRGTVMGLIGENGAGKTTILHTITGLIAPKAGKVTFEGQDITRMPGHKIVTKGIAHVPEGRRVFADLSVFGKS